MLTLTELKERLANRCDEQTLVDLLEINAEELVERFVDKIEEKFDILVNEFDDDEDEEEYGI
jgi:hypothetical protein